MASYEIFITFGIYLVFLMAIGVYFYSKTTTHESYVLGDRGVGYWVTAMSAQASDMSGWLLLGLPGAVYTSGLTEIWVVIGLALGTYLNWKFVAPALRVQTEKYNSLTVPSFISQKLNDKKGYIRRYNISPFSCQDKKFVFNKRVLQIYFPVTPVTPFTQLKG